MLQSKNPSLNPLEKPFKIFLSWSGNVSQELAIVFRTWLSDLIPEITAFVSSEDISKGELWIQKLTETLNEADFGILCVTQIGMRSTWLNYELGWLNTKNIPVAPFLFGVDKKEIEATPLKLYQVTFYEKEDIKKLIIAIISAYNKKNAQQKILNEPLFNQKWPNLQTQLDEIYKNLPPKLTDNDTYIFKSSDKPEFISLITELVSNAKKIIMIGTGLNILFSDSFRINLLEKAAKGECELEIYLADPESPNIHTRLIEEELGKIVPPVGYENLLRRLNSILEKIKQYKHQSQPHIVLNLFRNYPTFAYIQVDDEYFMYLYGFATLGNLSPVLRYKKSNPNHKDMIDFLNSDYELIKKHSFDAESIQKSRKNPESLKVENLYPIAIYFVPPINSKIYQFGSKILGFDIYNDKFETSPYHEYVGNAVNYGFHLTISDVLYYLSESEMKEMQKEIQFLAKSFREFPLTGLKITKNFPDQNSISITVDDPSGNLEILHTEVVSRIYKKAIASNYTLGLASLNRNDYFSEDRTKAILKIYKAPFILTHYRPHFTLLTNIPPGKLQDKIYRELVQSFEKIEKTVTIENLAILSYNKTEKKWVIIEDLIPLR